MKVAVSNIAWDNTDDARVAAALTDLGVQGVEIAPTTHWQDPHLATDEEIVAYRQDWRERGLTISSLQALLYGRSELVLFGSEDARDQTLAYLARISHLAGGLGAGPMVFGSPRNRKIGERPREEARQIAIEFFRRAAEDAHAAGAVLCLEANPPEYGADFATSTTDALAIVAAVDRPGFGMHLDLGGMQISEEPISQRIRECGPWLRHFHVSEPFLAPVGESKLDHDAIAATLRDIDYDGWISIEMRKTEADDPVESVIDAARCVVAAYGDG